MTTEFEKDFILHWGEMGSKWGLNRASAQVHAILLLSQEPLHAQQISDQLQLARSNVSVALKELLSWGLIQRIHLFGDRKEHFEAESDPWKMLALVADKRIENEILPTLKFLESVLQREEQPAKRIENFTKNLSAVLSGCLRFYKRARKLPLPLAKKVLRLEKNLEQLIGKGGTS